MNQCVRLTLPIQANFDIILLAMTDKLTRAKALYELGAHLGHRKSRLHPRARTFVYQIIDGVSVIDLEQTISQIDDAARILSGYASEGKTLLVCATKRAVSAKAAEIAAAAGAYYVTVKWLPGLITNFNTISKNVQKLIELKRQRDAGEWAKYVKHEQMALEKEVRSLERLYGGIVHMSKIPDIMLVVDTKREKNAVKEAKRSGIPLVAIVDTNSNPEEVDYPIMLNDDAPQAVEAVLTELLRASTKSAKAPDKSQAAVSVQEEAPVVGDTVTEATAPKKPAKKATTKKPRAKRTTTSK